MFDKVGFGKVSNFKIMIVPSDFGLCLEKYFSTDGILRILAFSINILPRWGNANWISNVPEVQNIFREIIR